MIKSVVIVSSGQQRDSVIHTHVSNLPLNFPPIQAHNIEQSSPCYTMVSISLKSPHSRGHTLANLPKLAFHASNMLHGLSPEPDLYFFTAPFTLGVIVYTYLLLPLHLDPQQWKLLCGHRLHLVSFTAISQHPEYCLSHGNHSLNIWEVDGWMSNKFLEALLCYHLSFSSVQLLSCI